MISAIPTRYRGTVYRSRLEARWACFFTALGWDYEYEPLDLPGYIPDFLLIIPRAPQILVECKPVTDMGASAVAHCLRLQRAWAGPAMLLGAVHWPRSEGTLCIGRARQPPSAWTDAHLMRINGTWGVTSEPVTLAPLDFLAARMAWSEAGNVTRWRAPKETGC